jgi:hypothetical protein
VKAFHPELLEIQSEFFTKSTKVYRKLSEYVHGNNETWAASGIALKENVTLQAFYENSVEDVVASIKFAYACRHLKQLDPVQKDNIQTGFNDLLCIEAIRKLFGGPKDIT